MSDSTSIAAYDLPERVRKYDIDMQIMHPNRAVMADVALAVAPFDTDGELTALELGSGTGYFTQRLLSHFTRPWLSHGLRMTVVALDGAAGTGRELVDAARIAALQLRSL